MGELGNRSGWASVGVVDGQAPAVWQALSAQASVADRGPGVTQAEAVQIGVELAALRDLVAAWGFARVVGFPTAGATVDPAAPRYVETFGVHGIEATADAMAKAGLDATFLVGDAPFYERGDGTPIPGWGRLLALAIDRILVTIGEAEQGPTEQARVSPGFLPAAVPLVVVVTGAVLSIIGTVAAWRYLDPDVRRDGMLVRQAAEDYAGRLAVFERTGTMPAPSPTEAGAIETVQRLAAARGATDWGIAAAVAGGITAGVVLLGVVGKQAAA